MRYYLLGEDKEFKFDLVKTTKISENLFQFEFLHSSHSTRVLIKKMFHKYFCSEDGVRWEKLALQNFPAHFLYLDQFFKLHRGFRPTKNQGEDGGALYTKMPGKVVKILVSPGQMVSKGQTLVILEAMKMENEIKSSVEGKVKYIHVQEGQALEQGVILMEIDQ